MPKPVALDTNLALLFIVGATDRSYVAKHKRLSAYELDDFDELCGLIDASSGILLCPNVVSETSNLARYVAEPIRTEISRSLAELVSKCPETYIASRAAVATQSYKNVGVTDSVLMLIAESGAVLLTDDLDLYLAASRAGADVINYNHVREARFT